MLKIKPSHGHSSAWAFPVPVSTSLANQTVATGFDRFGAVQTVCIGSGITVWCGLVPGFCWSGTGSAARRQKRRSIGEEDGCVVPGQLFFVGLVRLGLLGPLKLFVNIPLSSELIFS
jgi:hypothetical protein